MFELLVLGFSGFGLLQRIYKGLITHSRLQSEGVLSGLGMGASMIRTPGI